MPVYQKPVSGVLTHHPKKNQICRVIQEMADEETFRVFVTYWQRFEADQVVERIETGGITEPAEIAKAMLEDGEFGNKLRSKIEWIEKYEQGKAKENANTQSVLEMAKLSLKKKLVEHYQDNGGPEGDAGGDVTQDTQRLTTNNDSQEIQRETSGGGAASLNEGVVEVIPKRRDKLTRAEQRRQKFIDTVTNRLGIQSDGTDQQAPVQQANPTSTKTELANPQRAKKQERSGWFKQKRQLPFEGFIIEAIKYDDEQDVEEWESPLFFFIWMLRGHDHLKPYLDNPKAAMKEVEKYVCNWTKSAKRQSIKPRCGFHPGDCWMEWFGLPKADAEAEFMGVWEKIRFMPGHNPLDQAKDAAQRQRLGIFPITKDKRPDDFEFFVSIAGHLQLIMGDRVIFLPCREVGELLGVSPMTISRYRQWAQKDGYLKVVKKHHFSGGSGDATEFRFNTDLYSNLKEKVQQGTGENFQRASIQPNA